MDFFVHSWFEFSEIISVKDRGKKRDVALIRSAQLRLYLESSVVLHHNVGKVDPLSAADKLSDLWMVVCPDIVAHKVPVDAVSAALLLVQQDVRS